MNRKSIQIVLLSTLFGAIVCVVFLLTVSCAFVKMGSLPMQAVEIFAIISCAIGAISSGYICGRITRENGLIFGIICGLVLFVTVLLANVIIFRGSISLLALVKCIFMMLMGAIGSIFGVNKKEHVKRYLR